MDSFEVVHEHGPEFHNVEHPVARDADNAPAASRIWGTGERMSARGWRVLVVVPGLMVGYIFILLRNIDAF